MQVLNFNKWFPVNVNRISPKKNIRGIPSLGRDRKKNSLYSWNHFVGSNKFTSPEASIPKSTQIFLKPSPL
jgi:hypothetical protein